MPNVKKRLEKAHVENLGGHRMKTYRYVLDGIPSSNNRYIGRKNIFGYQAEKKEWAEKMFFYCSPKPERPLKKAGVKITYCFPDKRRRDPDNYSGKMLLDGLRAARVIRDDSFFEIELSLKAEFGTKTALTIVEVEDREDET